MFLLYYIILYTPYHTTLYHTILHYTIFSYTIFYYTIPDHTILYHIIPKQYSCSSGLHRSPKRAQRCPHGRRRRRAPARRAVAGAGALRGHLTEPGQTLLVRPLGTNMGSSWVWYGSLDYGMVWYGMVWYGMVWYGMVWYGMVWYGMVWYGMVWYGMVWYA